MSSVDDEGVIGAAAGNSVRPLKLAQIRALQRALAAEAEELRATLSELRATAPPSTDSAEDREQRALAASQEAELRAAISDSDEFIADLGAVAAAYIDAVKLQRRFTDDEVKCFTYFDFAVPPTRFPAETANEVAADAGEARTERVGGCGEGAAFQLPPLRAAGLSDSPRLASEPPETETDVDDVNLLPAGGAPAEEEEEEGELEVEQEHEEEEGEAEAAKQNKEGGGGRPAEGAHTRSPDAQRVPVTWEEEQVGATDPGAWSCASSVSPPLADFESERAAAAAEDEAMLAASHQPLPPPLSLPLSLPPAPPPSTSTPMASFRAAAAAPPQLQWGEAELAAEVARRVGAERERLARDAKAELSERLQCVRVQLEAAMERDLQRHVERAEQRLAVAHDEALARCRDECEQRFAAERAQLRDANANLRREVAVLEEALNAEQERGEALSVALREARDELTVAGRDAAALQQREEAVAARERASADEGASQRREWLELVRDAIDGDNAALRRANAALREDAAAARREYRNEVERVREELFVLPLLAARDDRGDTALRCAASLHRESLAAALRTAVREERRDAARLRYAVGDIINSRGEPHQRDGQGADALDHAVVAELNRLRLPLRVRCARLAPGGDYLIDQRVQLRLVDGGVLVRPHSAPRHSFEHLAAYLVRLYAPLLDADRQPLQQLQKVPGPHNASTSSGGGGASGAEERLLRLREEQRALQEVVDAQQRRLTEHQLAAAAALSPSPQPERGLCADDDGDVRLASPEPPMPPREELPAAGAARGGGDPLGPWGAAPSQAAPSNVSEGSRREQPRLRSSGGASATPARPATYVTGRGGGGGGGATRATPKEQRPLPPDDHPAAALPPVPSHEKVAAIKCALERNKGRIDVSGLDAESLLLLKKAAFAKQVRDMRKLQQQENTRPRH